MARTYKRDSRGRFASTGSARSGPKARMATKGTNRITRDNAGRITSVGGQGATARGGRLRTAAGNRRGAVVARMSLQRSGTIGKPKGLKPGAMKGKGVENPKAPKLSSTQRFVAQRAKDTFNDSTLLINGRLAKGYKESVQAIQKKFGVDNRIATKVFAKHSLRMGTSDIQYVDPVKAKRTIRAVRATTKVGSRLGGERSVTKLKNAKKIRSRSVQAVPERPARKAPKSLNMPTLKGVLKPPRIRLTGEGGAALRSVMISVPVVPKGRKPLSKDKNGQMLDVGLSKPMRIGGRQRNALEKELVRQGFSARSNALGGVRTYSKQFAIGNKNPRTGAEIITVQVQSKGGPLVGGSVSTRRTVFAPSSQRNVGGRLMERAYGLPVKPRGSTKPRRRRP